MRRKLPSLLQKHQARRYQMELEYTAIRSDLVRMNEGFYGFPVDPISFGYHELVMMLSILRRASREYYGVESTLDAKQAYETELAHWDTQIPEVSGVRVRKQTH